MAAADWATSLAIILKEEGGNDDDPHDRGGRTSRGITQNEWDTWRRSHPGLPEDVWQAPQAQVDEIYHEQYWNPYCDSLPAGLDLEFFNRSVNSGRTQAVKELQRALGVAADGMIGIETKTAIAAADLIPLIHSYAAQSRTFYRHLAQFPRYGNGWIGRTNRVEASAVAMANAQPVTHPNIDTKPAQPEVTVSPKADPVDMAQPPLSVQTAASGTAGASVISGVSDQLQSVSQTISPLADTLTIVKYICLAIAVVCAGLAIYAVIRDNRNKAVT